MKYDDDDEYDDDGFTLSDYWSLEAGDILIARKDIYTRKPIGSESNWTSTRLVRSWDGDKLFVPEGGKKKIRKVKYVQFYLSGFSPGVDVETLMTFFTIKDGQLKKDIRKYNM